MDANDSTKGAPRDTSAVGTTTIAGPVVDQAALHGLLQKLRDVGIPLMAILFGAYDQVSSMSALTALPIAAWEFSLGVWMILKGFKPSPVATSDDTGVLDLEATLVPAGV
jgi:hypothetical protein